MAVDVYRSCIPFRGTARSPWCPDDQLISAQGQTHAEIRTIFWIRGRQDVFSDPTTSDVAEYVNGSPIKAGHLGFRSTECKPICRHRCGFTEVISSIGGSQDVFQRTFAGIKDGILIAIQRWICGYVTLIGNSIPITIVTDVLCDITTVCRSIGITVNGRFALSNDLGTETNGSTQNDQEGEGQRLHGSIPPAIPC